MKKLLISSAALLLFQVAAFSQSPRLVLVEHFTQASCGPCASQNPTLEATLTANATKAIAIKHQVSWPGTDPMNAQYPSGPSDRRTFYGITGVPNTVLDGTQGPGAPNTIVTTTTINNRYAVASPFTVTPSFTLSGGMINVSVDINCTQAVSGNLVAHIAVVEKHIAFGSPPGSNGETDFYNVLKQYLPGTSGTALAANWSVGNSQTISESWTLSNVYDNSELAVIAFIQDNTTKEIHQAGFAPNVTPSANDDAGILNVTNAGNLCTTSFTPNVTLQNYGANNLTSATINYDLDGGSALTYSWTGSLASGNSTTVSLPTMTVTNGYHTFNAWTTLPNGQVDSNTGNDAANEPLPVGTNQVDVSVVTDCWGSETTWKIDDLSGNTWASGGPYTNVAGGSTENASVCLEAGDCYDFIINDSYGDGMYGSQYGSCTVDGTYTITDNASTTQLATIIAVNSDFGNQEINNFCVPSATMPVSSFSGNPTSVCAGSAVTFSDASTGNITSWNWTFPGGTPATSTLQNPTVTYAAAGNYDVTLDVSDGTNTDVSTLNSYITVFANPTASMSSTDATCGQANGTATAVPAGGSGPYTYSWSPTGGTGSTATGLSAGVYTCTITDANGCSGSEVVTVANPSAPVLSGSGVDATCAQNDGSATVTVSGGVSPFTYTWSPNVSSGSTASNLSAGTYDVIVTDANGCATAVQIIINAPALPTVSGTATNEICDGDCDGTVSATGTSGTAPYSYNWDGGLGTGQTHSNVCPGAYMVTITDANGCSSTSSVTVAAGSALPTASFTPSNTNVLEGSPVNFTNTSTGAVSYTWDFGDGNSSTNQNPSHSWTTAGTYTVTLTVMNADGCSAVYTADITVTEPTGVFEQDAADKIELYPNPTTGMAQVNWSSLEVDVVEVTNLLGEKIMSINNNKGLNMQLLDLSAQPNGVYFVTVHTNELQISKRMIVRK